MLHHGERSGDGGDALDFLTDADGSARCAFVPDRVLFEQGHAPVARTGKPRLGRLRGLQRHDRGTAYPSVSHFCDESHARRAREWHRMPSDPNCEPPQQMAYQARVAIDRMRFAIKHTERFAPHTDQMREAGLQLLDAVQRLETVDRRFQDRSRAAGAVAHERGTESVCDSESGARHVVT